MISPKVTTFFYGSYINLDVLGEVGLHPSSVEVARLDRVVGPAKAYDFPSWYVERLQTF